MAEISAIFTKIYLFWLFPLLTGRIDECKKDAELNSGYSDLEISDVWQKFLWQKFLPYVRNF